RRPRDPKLRRERRRGGQEPEADFTGRVEDEVVLLWKAEAGGALPAEQHPRVTERGGKRYGPTGHPLRQVRAASAAQPRGGRRLVPGVRWARATRAGDDRSAAHRDVDVAVGVRRLRRRRGIVAVERRLGMAAANHPGGSEPRRCRTALRTAA